MNYRGIEYYVAQGVEVGTWKFTTSMNDQIRTVRATNRQEAAEVVERRIEAALAPKRRFTKGADTVVKNPVQPPQMIVAAALPQPSTIDFIGRMCLR